MSASSIFITIDKVTIGLVSLTLGVDLILLKTIMRPIVEIVGIFLYNRIAFIKFVRNIFNYELVFSSIIFSNKSSSRSQLGALFFLIICEQVRISFYEIYWISLLHILIYLKFHC